MSSSENGVEMSTRKFIMLKQMNNQTAVEAVGPFDSFGEAKDYAQECKDATPKYKVSIIGLTSPTLDTAKQKGGEENSA